MSVYTYVVDHGDESPSVGAEMQINGGKCIGVTFDDLQRSADLMEEKLQYIANIDVFDSILCRHIKDILQCKSIEELEAL